MLFYNSIESLDRAISLMFSNIVGESPARFPKHEMLITL
jgi:hypothetical protein